MTDQLPYHKPTPQDESVRRLRSAQRVVITGVSLITIGLTLALGPLLWGKLSLNKYIVTIGILSLCVGASCILHGGWDWIRERGR